MDDRISQDQRTPYRASSPNFSAAPGAHPSAIHVSALCKTYGTDDTGVMALDDINLDIRAGEFVTVVGPSGCGKSTLMRMIAGLIAPSRGEIRLGGDIVRGTRRDIGIVFQSPVLFPWRTVLENVLIPIDVQRRGRQQNLPKARDLLAMVGLADFAHRYPAELSGGMQQRVGIARALVNDPAILLMDEPFGALDALTRRSLQDELLRIWAATGKTIVFVTHSIEESIYLADRIVVLTYRPGTIKRDIRVELPRPRDSASAAFNALKRDLSALVTAEQHRFEEVEMKGLTTD